MTVVLFAALAACAGSPAPSPCAVPDRAPQVLTQAVPDVPPLAQQQGIMGDVVVRVTVDGAGAVTGVRIVSSPSAILNFSALQAARSSSYRPGMQNCTPGGSVDVLFRFTS